MLRHIVMYKLKDNSKENRDALVAKFMSMKGNIPELIDVVAGANKLDSERSYDVVLETTFACRADLDKYQVNPFHLDVKEYVHSVIEKSHSVDYGSTIMAIINLEDGRSMRANLFREKAPLSVDNFIKLAESDFYNGLIFHRVIKDFMIQGGGFNENMEQKGGLTPIKGEFKSNGVQNDIAHTVGTLSMARTSDPNSATSQFFICTNDDAFLNGEYAAFGRLIDEESINVAKDISMVDTHRVSYFDDVPCEPITIKNIEIIVE